jgi:hypothetical protein
MIAVAACFVSATASAQAVDSARVTTDDAAVSASAAAQPAGPRIDATSTAVRNVTQSPDAALFQRAQPMAMGKPMAMMIVGGAAIVLGAVIGNDIGMLFMIGGSVSVLIGLYQHLK